MVAEDAASLVRRRRRPDALAYETYLSSRATALVDLLLYASATNWAAATRPAYSRLVGFPLSWAVPPAVRADALRRVGRFGFTDMDADGAGVEEEEGGQDVPAAFRWTGLRREKSVMESLTAEQMVGIRLCEFAKGVLEVMRDWLEKSGEEEAESSTGCLVYGCLALMIRPEVPRGWLRRLIEEEFAGLMAFFDRSQMRLEGAKENIPRSDYRPSAGRVGARVLHQVVQSVPTLGGFYLQEWRRRVAEKTGGLDRRAALLLSGLVLTGAALGYGYHLYRGVQPFGRSIQVFTADRKRHGSGKFGALGDLLGMPVNGITGPPGARRNATSVVDFGGPDQPHHVVADVQVELHRGSNDSNDVD